MIPHCLHLGDILPADLALVDRIREVVTSLPDGLDCHAVCRAIEAAEPGVTAIRGKFAGAGHSWLEIVDRPLLIIDPYPWATATGPVLITLDGYLNPWRFIYDPLPAVIRANDLYRSRLNSPGSS